jgi:phosphatidylglycerophosphatase C
MTDIAAFDLDGTLTEGGSVFDFLAAVAGTTQVVTATVPLAPRLAHAAIAGGTAADDTKEALFAKVLGGRLVDEVTETAHRFGASHLRDHLRHDVRQRFERHKERGDLLVLVSASPELYVSTIASLLGADAAIGTRLEVGEDARLTGRYNGENCRGEEKVRRLEEWVSDIAPTGARRWAYGNSRGDLRLLRSADIGVSVARLGRFSRLKDFPTLAATEHLLAGD